MAGGAMPVRAILAVLAALVVLSLLALSRDRTTPLPEVDRVIVLSVPTLTWADIDEEDTPHLAALARASLVGNLSPAVGTFPSTPGDAYVTLGAGTRAVGAPGVDGSATGDAPGPVVHKAAGEIAERNEGNQFGPEVGALGDRLHSAGLTAAVVANAESAKEDGRQAVTALMTADGVVPAGSVAPDLVVDDPAGPGPHLDIGAVVDALPAPGAADVVLVEASDLARGDSRSGEPFDGGQPDAIERSDGLVGRILDEVDPERDAVLLVAPYPGPGEWRLTVAAVRAPGVEPGLLRSAVTGRGGSVGLTDVAPTILTLLGVEPPSSMEGRPFERDGTGGAAAERLEALVEVEQEAQHEARELDWVEDGLILAVALAALSALALLPWGRAWTLAVLEVVALAVLAVPAVVYLVGLLPDPTATTSRAGIGVGALAVAVGARLLRARHPLDPLIAVVALLVGTLVVDTFVGNPLQFNTPLGYSALGAGRFSGLGNTAFALLAAGSIVLAGLLTARFPDGRGRWAAIGVIGVAVVVDAAPWWGADVGGLLTLVPAGGVTLLLLDGRRPRPRTVGVLGAGAVVAVLAVASVDVALPAASETHLARLSEAVADGGVGHLGVVTTRKLHAALGTFGSAPWSLAFPVTGAFLATLVLVAGERLRRVRDVFPASTAVAMGLAVATVAGTLLNDSGLRVGALVLAVAVPSLVYLLAQQQTAVPAAAVDRAAVRRTGRHMTTSLVLLALGALVLRLPSLLAGRHLSDSDGAFGLATRSAGFGDLFAGGVPSPVEPLFLTVVWLADHVRIGSLGSPRLAAVAAGVGAAVATYLVGRRLASPSGGVLAAVLIGASGSVLWVSGPLAPEGVAVALVLAALALAAGEGPGTSSVRSVATGVLLAVACAVEVAVAPAVLPVAGLIAVRGSRRNLGRLAAAFGLAGLALWLPSLVHRSVLDALERRYGRARDLGLGDAARFVTRVLRDRDPILLAAVIAAAVTTTVAVGQLARRRRAGGGRGVGWSEYRSRWAPAALLVGWVLLQAAALLADPVTSEERVALLVPPLALAVVVVPPRRALLPVAVAALMVFPWQFDGSVRPLITPGRHQAEEAAAVDALRALPDDGLVISDAPGLVWQSERRSPPELVDLARAVTDGPPVTPGEVLEHTRRPEVCAVLVWASTLAGMVPHLEPALVEEGFVVTEQFGAIPDATPEGHARRTLWSRRDCRP